MKNITVLGSGTWGVALARMLALEGYRITVWSPIEAEVRQLNENRRHPNLPNAQIPDSIVFTSDIASVCGGKDIIVFAVPSVFVRSTAKAARPFIPDGQIIVDVAKGFEKETLLTMSGVIRDELNKDGQHDHVQVVALSGPTHAEEVAMDLPTTIVSACEDLAVAEKVQAVFMNNTMRVYTNTDVLGVELCGALKNVIALAAGISTGLGYGDNAKAALITRGIAELTRLGTAMGCNEQTFHGLAGVGDLIVTATSVHSRNNKAGYLIGKGLTPEEAVKEVGMVVEGLYALPAAVELAKKYNIEMPIVMALDTIIAGTVSPIDAVNRLMGRCGKMEGL